MELHFALNGRTGIPYYVVYTPVRCKVRLKDGQPGAPPVTIQLSNNDPLTGGQLVFYATPTSEATSTLSVDVPGDNTFAIFYIGGKLNAASINYNDAAINFKFNDQSLLIVKFTVRVRKNANLLTPIERDRFLSAFVNFVISGQYQNFLDMHNEAVSSQIHNRAAFLPWHRIYLLDLERHLQQIDKMVMIPYWDFQAPAPNVFTLDFMGIPTSSTVGVLQFSLNNPLINWHLENLPSLARRPRFNAQQDRAIVEARSTTLARLPGFRNFASMEGNPHGSSHTSFTGPINFAPTAPQDPLFFMLHSNVDRIWAEWQMLGSGNTLFDSADINAYNPVTIRSPNPRIGDFLNDTMWPWNGITGGDRPATAPGGPLIASLFTNYPGTQPKVIDTIDYQGRITNKSLYFDYDALPYTNTIIAPQNVSAMSMDKKQSAGDLETSLNNSDMLTDKNDIEKEIAILKNKDNDTGTRVSALSKLLEAISLDEGLIKYILQVLEDKKEPTNLRREVLRTIETISFSSPIFPSLQPDIIQVFRGLITDRDPEISRDAIAYLAKSKDEFIQRVLISGLQKPEDALVPEEFAVHFLGYDIHAGIYPLLQKIVKTSSNNDSRAEALYLLAGDPLAKELLLSTFNNRNERFDVRKNSLMALKFLSPTDFLKIAKKVVTDNQESENIRAISLNALNHYRGGAGKIDKKFISQLMGTDLRNLSKELASAINSFLASHENRNSNANN